MNLACSLRAHLTKHADNDNPSSQAIDTSEYEAMCKGLKNPSPPPITDDLSRWMNEAQWASLDILTTLPAFTNLAKEMEKSSDDWYNWCMNEASERVNMPGDWGKSLSDFKKLLIIRSDGMWAGLYLRLNLMALQFTLPCCPEYLKTRSLLALQGPASRSHHKCAAELL
jgi:hypothetical protein